MSGEALLPAGFEELVPYLDVWARDSFQERVDARFSAEMQDIQGFYDVMTPRMGDAFSALDAHPLDALPAPESRLFKMLMALAHVAHAVERHGQPRPANTLYPNTLRVVNGPLPA